MIPVDTSNAAAVAVELKRIQTEFAKPFEASEIKIKPAMVKGNRALALHYIDARCVMDRLDAVVGPVNWADKYTVLPDGSVVCDLSVRLDGEWITKADVGSLSEQPDSGDRLKAAFSDALKRAAVKFGIGRFLYRMPQQWMDYDPVKRQIVRPGAPPAARAEPARPKAGPEKPDNLALRAKRAMELGASKAEGDYLATCKTIADDVKAGLFSEADRLALKEIAREVGARFPALARA